MFLIQGGDTEMFIYVKIGCNNFCTLNAPSYAFWDENGIEGIEVTT